MSSQKIRCEQDCVLAESLAAEPEVIRMNDFISRHEEQQTPGTRRHLLATSVRLSAKISPKIHEMAKHCGDKLGLTMPLELYAYNSPQFNAACFKPEEGRLFIMFSSSLLEGFSDQELLFVLGHELGHHIYNHHQIPIGYLMNQQQKPSPLLAMQLFAWSRYAEFSADRAGAYCANDLHSVGKALFKLSSGITSDKVVQFDLDDFIKQVDDMQDFDDEPGKSAPAEDWFSTHPFSPLRVKALVEFHQSELMKKSGFSKSELELNVQQIMRLMEPGYLEGRTKNSRILRNLFIAAAGHIANIDSNLSKAETALFEQFFTSVDDEINIKKLDLSRLSQLLPKRIEEANTETSKTQRMQVIRDLCLIAKADNPSSHHKNRPEIAALYQIAEQLSVPEQFVSNRLAQSYEMD